MLCEELKIPKQLRDDGITEFVLGPYQESEELPMEWWARLGVPLEVANRVVQMNDGLRGQKKTTFKKIADYIEEAVEETNDPS